MLRVNNLIKDFSTMRAVDRLSFELHEGEICGFIGPNGAGKTTTMRIIATLEEPTAGEVFVDGLSIFEEPYKVRRALGFMPDHFGTYPALNVRDYLEFYARAYEIDPSIRSKRIGQIMEFTGLDKITEKEVETLSKGMRQRLNLGRALINDPRIMVMDEPAAGLDPRARIELRYLIKSLAERGKTMFVSSHILTELSEICDSMLIIDKGKRITFGTFKDIQKEVQSGFDIFVRLMDATKAEALERFLLERPKVNDVRMGEAGTATFGFLGESEDLPSLLGTLMSEGFPVIEFKPQTMSMEDVFIHITEGTF